MSIRHPFSFRVYALALAIYPRRFRRTYCEQMLQTVRDARIERRVSGMRFWSTIYFDLLKSSISEHLFMVRNYALRRSVRFHALALAMVLSIIGLGAAVTMQQMLRRGADQPQIEMANWYAAEIASGEKPGNAIPPGYVDLERSLEPFVIFYDDHGRASAGTGYLNQALPTPPEAVLEYVRQHGSEHVTWQPRPGVRIASVIQRVTGNNPGFVLSGRSLRVVEEQEGLLWRMSFGIWFVVLAVLFGGATFLNRVQDIKRQPAL